jgi:hypothetical protein
MTTEKTEKKYRKIILKQISGKQCVRAGAGWKWLRLLSISHPDIRMKLGST